MVVNDNTMFFVIITIYCHCNVVYDITVEHDATTKVYGIIIDYDTTEIVHDITMFVYDI